MYVIELSFDGDPRRLNARPAHRERVARLHAEGKLVAAGPWDDDSGALLVFDVDESGIAEIIEADDYYRAPGVTVVSVRPWQPIFRPATQH
jgi:uncharacterized protein YciI